jgi:hypothetical protein
MGVQNIVKLMDESHSKLDPPHHKATMEDELYESIAVVRIDGVTNGGAFIL